MGALKVKGVILGFKHQLMQLMLSSTGDASMTRADAFIGDNRNFQDILYDFVRSHTTPCHCSLELFFQDLLQLGKFGDNGPDGNNTVFNLATLIGMKQQNIQMDQAANTEVVSLERSLSIIDRQ